LTTGNEVEGTADPYCSHRQQSPVPVDPLLLLGMTKRHQQYVRLGFPDPIKNCFVVELV
jgi:hypothetical protein